MIQELLGGPAPAPAPSASALLGLGGDTKISIHGGPHHHLFQTSNSSPNYSTLSPSTSPSPTTSTTPTTPSTTNPTSSTQNLNNNGLRCPRCDSSNTKFCYYNNYNLTQPRHFCKTCRRYWTKGGALRNVPIGGGCRKNKTSTLVTSSKSTNAKLFKTMSPEIGRTAFDVLDHDHDLSSNPILWGSSSSSSPQSSHLLALLRATSQNPNPSSNHVKEEILIGSGTQPVVETGALNGRPIGLDSSNHPFLSSLWRSSNNQQQQNGGLVGGDVGMQELYQRLIRSSSSSTTNSSYHHHHHNSNSQSQPVLLMSNAASSSSSVLESAPVIGGGGEMGYGWNVPAFSWSDLPTTNGAYP